jgi:hypothetical protein
MDVEIIYESPFAILRYYPEKGIIHHETHQGPWQGKEFREMMTLGTKILTERKADKWLSDDRQNVTVSKEEMQWGVEKWFPETLKSGWKYWAIVKPKHVISQIHIERVAKEYETQGLIAKFFTDVDQAFEWLTNL